ncbi:MAG: hypothetical protein JSR77_10460 [Planctomycetes bacterium]|nr:hypothetical protein [Planctomycetota bacterium]
MAYVHFNHRRISLAFTCCLLAAFAGACSQQHARTNDAAPAVAPQIVHSAQFADAAAARGLDAIAAAWPDGKSPPLSGSAGATVLEPIQRDIDKAKAGLAAAQMQIGTLDTRETALKTTLLAASQRLEAAADAMRRGFPEGPYAITDCREALTRVRGAAEPLCRAAAPTTPSPTR